MPRQSVRSNSALAALLYLGGCLADPDQCPNVKQQRPKYWLANRVVCTAWYANQATSIVQSVVVFGVKRRTRPSDGKTVHRPSTDSQLG